MDCPTCGHANPDGSKFCRGCGGGLAIMPSTAVSWACTHCHHTNRDGTRFCAGCGSPAGEASAPPSPSRDSAVAASFAHAVSRQLPSDEGAIAAPGSAEVSPGCPHCGAFYKPGVRFCKACGQSVEGQAKVDHPAPAPTEASASPSMTPILEPSPVLSAEQAAKGEMSAGRPMHEARPSALASTPPQAASASLDPTPHWGRGKTIAMASATVVLVAGIGTVVAWKLLQRDTSTSVASATLSPMIGSRALTHAPPPSASSGASLAITPTAVVEPKPAASATTVTSASTMATSAPKQADAETLPASTSSMVVRAPAPPTSIRASEPPRKAHAPMPATEPSMQRVALKLVRQGERAFDEQNYSTAIANAKAALEMQPGNTRASHLLQEAQQAQQNAMNSISIH